MPDYSPGSIQQIANKTTTIVCPFCNGAGCEICQNTGQLEVSPEELAQLQALMQNRVYEAPSNIPLSITQAAALKQKIKRETIPGSRITIREIKTKAAGLIAFALIVGLIGGAYLSNKYLGSYLPYLATTLSVISLSLAYVLTKKVFWQYQAPNDFISWRHNFDLQKPTNVGVK